VCLCFFLIICSFLSVIADCRINCDVEVASSVTFGKDRSNDSKFKIQSTYKINTDIKNLIIFNLQVNNKQMFVISTIHGHLIHYHYHKSSCLVSTNRDETVWLASHLPPLPPCYTDQSQLSQGFVLYRMRSTFDIFIECSCQL
jgi:frataxin-like iron-binding protein CyaY